MIMVTRGVVLATILVSNWIISIPQVVTANVTPQVELMMHHVVEHVDTLVANGDITTPKQFFQELQTRKETISHPYARYIVRSLEKDMQERYAFLQEKTQVAKGSFVGANSSYGTRVSHLGNSKTIAGEFAEKKDTTNDTIYQVQVAKENIPEVAPVKEEVFVTASVDPVSVTTPELPLSEEVVTVDTANPTPTGNDQRYTLTDGRINTSQLARTRIRWVNEFRKKEGVKKEIVHQPLMDKTAVEWSYYQRSISDRTHRRTPHSAFYDYQEITTWFSDRGLQFTNVNRATHTENVGLSTLYCQGGGDCTQAAEKSLSHVFDYFIKEKGTNYTAHYDTIVQPYFGEMGFGIAIDESTDMIYSTMHYATEAIRKPAQLTSR